CVSLPRAIYCNQIGAIYVLDRVGVLLDSIDPLPTKRHGEASARSWHRARCAHLCSTRGGGGHLWCSTFGHHASGQRVDAPSGEGCSSFGEVSHRAWHSVHTATDRS